MSWPAEETATHGVVSPSAPRMTATLELPASPAEVLDVLRHDRQVLVRDTLLWQRWIRYVALASLIALSLLVGTGSRTSMIWPLGVTALLYVLTVAITASRIRHAELLHEVRLPALLVTADILTLASLVYFSAPLLGAGRILIGATLVVQLSVFYFGRTLGSYAAMIATAAYLAVTLVLPIQHETARLPTAHVSFSAGVFVLICGALINAFGSFRERMNKLRLFCKLVEEGDLTPNIDIFGEKRADDLTLLARSFDAMRSRLAEQIGTDPLTGCLNRRALETRLRVEWRSAKRRSSTVAVLAIDLDHFKQINDTRGHPFGDIVLQELAGMMKSTARDTDAVARLGGDEFVIVLPDTGWQGALTFAERLRRKADDFAFGASSSPMRVTISVGVALARGTDPISPEMLLQEADRSLYKAKSAGRNRIFA